jgi:hypothetical protein
MSLKSWEKEFYPVAARYCAEENALEHTLKKWIGALPRNRKKHGCRFDGINLMDSVSNSRLVFTTHSCALCIHYEENDCSDCPLKRCYAEGMPYDVFVDTGAVTPMIKHIKAAIKREG